MSDTLKIPDSPPTPPPDNPESNSSKHFDNHDNHIPACNEIKEAIVVVIESAATSNPPIPGDASNAVDTKGAGFGKTIEQGSSQLPSGTANDATASVSSADDKDDDGSSKSVVKEQSKGNASEEQRNLPEIPKRDRTGNSGQGHRTPKPKLAVGSKCEYIGDNLDRQSQYAGVLTVAEINYGKVCLTKPNGKYTTKARLRRDTFVVATIGDVRASPRMIYNEVFLLCRFYNKEYVGIMEIYGLYCTSDSFWYCWQFCKRCPQSSI